MPGCRLDGHVYSILVPFSIHDLVQILFYFWRPEGIPPVVLPYVNVEVVQIRHADMLTEKVLQLCFEIKSDHFYNIAQTATVVDIILEVVLVCFQADLYHLRACCRIPLLDCFDELLTAGEMVKSNRRRTVGRVCVFLQYRKKFIVKPAWNICLVAHFIDLHGGHILR